MGNYGYAGKYGFFHSAMFCLLATLNYICDQKLKHNGQKFSTVVMKLKKRKMNI